MDAGAELPHEDTVGAGWLFVRLLPVSRVMPAKVNLDSSVELRERFAKAGDAMRDFMF